MKKLLIIGYGNVGKLLATKILANIPEFQITLAGRNIERVKATAENLENQFTKSKVDYIKVDAADKSSLLEAFEEIDMVIVASSSLKYTRNVVEAALDTKTHYFDTQLSSKDKITVLESYRDDIQRKELIFITDGGYHPGIPGAMITWAKQKLGSLAKANIYAALKMDWSLYQYTKSTNHEMLEELKSFDCSYYQDREWKKVNWSKIPKWDFEEPYYELSCMPMVMEEIRCAPDEIEEIEETGFFISGFNPLMDRFLMPILMFGIKVLPASMYGPLGKLFEWGLKKGKPPYGVMLVADCKGSDGSLCMKVHHEDGYEITVVPVVACLKQYISGHIKPGLHLQAWVVEPKQFFADLKALGINVEVEQK
ncbi:saccharopine dehydrogenase NADP-binding domain-containing protein [Candidatus Uabimicrobium amorphum]|uniref:Glutamyl-tRNA reductase n=1 Tax=Uabimicrobium amorphum TaxID=2596890 RepID=A0A5S9F713_UABAM|nr:saccharopine dehydrogenase NADP-binding domain-containing protein [Candidatus Uabimicrobium amorphum]BBM87154.1 glutamyl-tRNA reductase [Candidatus Uabimicrobium amorphum]